MAEAKKANYTNKSGTESTEEYLKLLGGLPDEKSQEAIDKANQPKDAPGSVRR